jgi:DNA replication and repair protein RecF
VVKNFYLQIAANEELIDLKYESQLQNTPFEELLIRSRERDLVTQRSNAGVHKDDISALLKEYSFKSIASQGQRKSLLFAMKFAEFELLKQNKGFPPILLLDDVFEKLDDKRMQNLLQWVCVNNQGQVFITDTHFDRLNDSLDSFGIKHQIIELT